MRNKITIIFTQFTQFTLYTLYTLCTLCTQYTLNSQWYRQTVPTDKNIIGIKFVDSLKGWAATSWGTTQDTSCVINTTNGGTTWNIQFRYGIGFFEAFWMVDALTGYVGGYSPLPGPGPIVFKTTNGGINWLSKGAPSGPTDFFFINKDTGWYCNNAFAADVRLTTDGGNTWQLRNSGITENAYRTFFLNETIGWLGSYSHIYKTTNLGQNWIVIGSFSNGASAIYFLNEYTGWLGTTNRQIFFTSNGGINWISQPNPGYAGTIDDFYFSDLQTGYAGNGSIYLYKTTNNGQLWGYQRDSSNSYRICFLNNMQGWTGQAGISHTTNGGGPIIYLGIINVNGKIPENYTLSQNYPNPFNSQTKIRFSLTKSSYAELKIYDILGKELNPWIFGWYPEQLLEPGTHEISFDASDMASGTYFYKLIVTDKALNTLYEKTRKMILIK